jgi:hypothetical protein
MLHHRLLNCRASGLLERPNAPERRSRAVFQWKVACRRRVIGGVRLLTLNLLTVPQVLTPDPYPKIQNAIWKVVAEFVEPAGFQQLKKSTFYFRDRLLRRLDEGESLTRLSSISIATDASMAMMGVDIRALMTLPL